MRIIPLKDKFQPHRWRGLANSRFVWKVISQAAFRGQAKSFGRKLDKLRMVITSSLRKANAT
jgi:hypothetical protein